MPLGEVWRRLELATGPHTCTEFEQIFFEREINIHPSAEKMMCGSDFEVTTEPRTIKLVEVYPKDLNLCLPDLPTLYTAAKSKGLRLCPKEVAPQICIQYLANIRFVNRTQPSGPTYHEWYAVATEPLRDAMGNDRIFDILRLGNDKWLHSYLVYPNRRWSNNTSFIFMQDE